MNDKRQGKGGPKSKHIWSLMMHEYCTSPEGEGEVTCEMLAQKYGASVDAVKKRAAREKWTDRRKQHRDDIASKTLKKDAETAAQRRHRHATYLKIVQAKARNAMLSGDTIPAPRDGTEAVKAERALYGEAGEVAQVEITDRDKRMAAAYWKANLDLMEKDSDGD